MSDVGQKERETQNRVIKLFRERLGYENGGNLEDQDNSNVDEAMLRQNLLARGYDEEIVGRAIQQLLTAASLGAGQSLYDANRRVYDLLRYGAKVKGDVGEQFETVKLIEWDTATNNDFVVAEEVTIKGEHTKRPDIVLYVNGIALGVIELEESSRVVDCPCCMITRRPPEPRQDARPSPPCRSGRRRGPARPGAGR
jgi:type I restriction enzyme, R subunit